MNKQELIDYCNAIKENKSQIINCIDVNGIIKKIEQLDESKKVTVPQFVADWIEECKNDDFHLFGAMEGISSNQKKLDYWFREDDNMELFARAWLDGYEVEKEKQYYVRFKGMESDDFNYLNFIKFQHAWVLSSLKIDKKFRTEHTRKELEDAGFGWVFSCEGIEVEEVE